MPVCSGVLHWSDVCFFYFIIVLFGFKFMNTPVCMSAYLIFFTKNLGVCVEFLGALWCYCACARTAKQISISWHLREHICSEALTSGSHIFSHHHSSHWTRVHRRENRRGAREDEAFKQGKNKESFKENAPLYLFFYALYSCCCFDWHIFVKVTRGKLTWTQFIPKRI